MNTVTFYLDTEFNGFGGELISMALVSPVGHEFYEVVEIKQNYDLWVAQNVIPHLNKNPISVEAFKKRLEVFLTKFSDCNVEIIADWPDDIRYFCESLILGPGYSINTPRVMTFIMNRDLPDTATHSKIPHNALEDARALSRFHDS